MAKEDFKQFVKKHPELAKKVNNNEMTWQKFYEMYDLYGEDENVWKEYLTASVVTASSFDLLNWLKNVDVDALQENINSVKRVIGVVQDLGKSNDTSTSSYKPRPIYQHFED